MPMPIKPVATSIRWKLNQDYGPGNVIIDTATGRIVKIDTREYLTHINDVRTAIFKTAFAKPSETTKPTFTTPTSTLK